LSALEIILLVLVLAFAGAFAFRERFWKAALAAEKRRGDDRAAELQTKLDRADTAAFVRIREAIAEGKTFEAVAALESPGVQANLDWFRERLGMLEAARSHAEGAVRSASALITNVNGENTLLRMMLEKAVALPLDTPPAMRQLYLERAAAVLSTPRATADCPSEDFWKAYIARHKALHGDPTVGITVEPVQADADAVIEEA
jgi:hypothetical protein